MAKLQCGVVVQSHTVHILVITLVHAGLTLALWLHAPASSTVSLTKDSTLWIGSTSLPSISCWGLNLIWKSAHLVQVLQIGIFHCLASLSMWWDWFTHTLLDAKLCSYTVIYTSTRCLAHVVTHYFHRFQCLAVYDIDSSNVGPPPRLRPRWGAPPMGPFSRYYSTCNWLFNMPRISNYSTSCDEYWYAMSRISTLLEVRPVWQSIFGIFQACKSSRNSWMFRSSLKYNIQDVRHFTLSTLI